MVATQTLVLTGALLTGVAVCVVCVVKGRRAAYADQGFLERVPEQEQIHQATSERFNEYQAHPEQLAGIKRRPTYRLETQDEHAPLDYPGAHVMAKAFNAQAGEALFWTDETLAWLRQQ